MIIVVIKKCLPTKNQKFSTRVRIVNLEIAERHQQCAGIMSVSSLKVLLKKHIFIFSTYLSALKPSRNPCSIDFHLIFVFLQTEGHSIDRCGQKHLPCFQSPEYSSGDLCITKYAQMRTDQWKKKIQRHIKIDLMFCTVVPCQVFYRPCYWCNMLCNILMSRW